MKAKIAVATTSGKAYCLIVGELKRKSAPFLGLTPTERIPIEIKAVITTEKEKQSIHHERVLTYQENVEPEALLNEALRIVQGKEYYERVVIGLDPGEVFGLAVLADGRVIKTGNCFSAEEAVEKMRRSLKNLDTTPMTSISVKIGDGVPACKEKLLHTLDETLPSNIMLESVSEAGTDRHLNEAKHRRGLRDVVSATRIAGRNGQAYPRRKVNEPNC